MLTVKVLRPSARRKELTSAVASAGNSRGPGYPGRSRCTTSELPCGLTPSRFPEHVVIDYSDVSSSQIEKKAKRLRACAEARGWQFRAGAT